MLKETNEQTWQSITRVYGSVTVCLGSPNVQGRMISMGFRGEWANGAREILSTMALIAITVHVPHLHKKFSFLFGRIDINRSQAQSICGLINNHSFIETLLFMTQCGQIHSYHRQTPILQIFYGDFKLFFADYNKGKGKLEGARNRRMDVTVACITQRRH